MGKHSFTYDSAVTANENLARYAHLLNRSIVENQDFEELKEEFLNEPSAINTLPDGEPIDWLHTLEHWYQHNWHHHHPDDSPHQGGQANHPQDRTVATQSTADEHDKDDEQRWQKVADADEEE